MIAYWETLDGRSGLVPGAGTVVLPDGGQKLTAATVDDLPAGAREAYDALPVVTVPTSLTPLQLRMTLLEMGMLDTVDPVIEALPEPQRSAARIAWEYATAFERSHPLVAAVAQAADMTDDQVDALFMAGAQI